MLSTGTHPVGVRFATQVRRLQQIGAEFHARGWSLGTSSNYSTVVNREPLQLLLTASGKDKGRLGDDDFVLVDDKGRSVEADAPRPSAETLLHCVLAHHGPGSAPGGRFGSLEALALFRINAVDAAVKGALEHGLGRFDS